MLKLKHHPVASRRSERTPGLPSKFCAKKGLTSRPKHTHQTRAGLSSRARLDLYALLDKNKKGDTSLNKSHQEQTREQGDRRETATRQKPSAPPPQPATATAKTDPPLTFSTRASMSEAPQPGKASTCTTVVVVALLARHDGANHAEKHQQLSQMGWNRPKSTTPANEYWTNSSRQNNNRRSPCSRMTRRVRKLFLRLNSSHRHPCLPKASRCRFAPPSPRRLSCFSCRRWHRRRRLWPAGAEATP